MKQYSLERVETYDMHFAYLYLIMTAILSTCLIYKVGTCDNVVQDATQTRKGNTYDLNFLLYIKL
jgi:hypothetical protein